jgi:Family of unknown function (DUF6527)
MKLHLLCENAGLFNETQYVFHCPGCSYSHAIRVRGPEPCWGWNGSTETPTITPSILVNKDLPESRCHSFVTNGKIQFLSDCFHTLKGQTVDIPDWED